MTRRELLYSAAGLQGADFLSGPCAGASSKIKLAPQGERGTPLVVEGRVNRPDGATPAAGVTVYAYQTGADGRYTKPGSTTMRIHGWLTTDGEGRFRIDTVRPGPYPQSRVAAHIHLQCWSHEFPPQHTPELMFEDDEFVTSEDLRRAAGLGDFRNVHRVGNGRVVHNVRLKTTADRFEDNVMHGLTPCRAPKPQDRP
jgi:protocatechuate 3,4-dioxygenase beta subunit